MTDKRDNLETYDATFQAIQPIFDSCFVDLRFIYTLNTKTLYYWLTKPQILKLNAKTEGLCSPTEVQKIVDELGVDELRVSESKTS